MTGFSTAKYCCLTPKGHPYQDEIIQAQKQGIKKSILFSS